MALAAGQHVLTLYHPPFDPDDPEAEGEDAFFVGPTLGSIEDIAPLWEYIRRYMQYGPGQKGIPEQADVADSIYCGKPSWSQFRMECNPYLLQTPFHMLSQVTCSWPKFPKEWESDSGIGEPEDNPVQTGAVMTAMVYRMQGKLSKTDEVELMRRYGTEQGLADALARQDDGI
ncbi:MAG: hypothetical protein LBE62_15415 [Azonexus sp.]|nr:hypothetical protein [Azonexus sp.]